MAHDLTPQQKVRLLEKALHYAGDYHTWDDVVAGLREGRQQIFDGPSGSIVTEIVQLPRKRFVHCWLLGGRLPEVLDLVPEIEKHAIANDCAELMASGRRGWDRVLPRHGWQITGSTFRKEIGHAQ